MSSNAPLPRHGGDLAALRLEVSGTPLPGCSPPYWLSDAAVRASHRRCRSPEEALAVESAELVALVCPCACHGGDPPPVPYRPAPGPNALAVAPYLAERRPWPPSYRGGGWR